MRFKTNSWGGKYELPDDATVGDDIAEIAGAPVRRFGFVLEGGAIALNVRFLGEALNAIKTPQIVIETQTPQSPGVFKPVGTEGYLHIVMPMTVR